MVHKFVDVALGSLLWILVLPILIPLLLITTGWRALISLWIRFKYPAFEPLNYYDTVSGGLFISYALHVGGSINIQKLREPFHTHFLAKDKAPKFPVFSYSTTTVGGFGYKVKVVEEPDLNCHIREVILSSVEDEELDKVLFSLMGENTGLGGGLERPIWEIVVVQLPSRGRSVLLLKINHALADAYSYFYLLNILTENEWEDTSRKYRPRKQSIFYKIGLFLKAPWILIGWYRVVKNGVSSKHPFGFDLISTRGLTPVSPFPKLVSSTNLEFRKVKEISKVTGTKVLSVLMALHFWCLKKSAEKHTPSGQILNKPLFDELPVTFMLPMPNHPALTEGRCTNHMAFGNINHTLNQSDRFSNLAEVDRSCAQTLGNDTPAIVSLIYNFFGSLFPPSWILWAQSGIFPSYYYPVTPFVCPSANYQVQGMGVDKLQLVFNGQTVDYVNGIAFGSITKGEEMEVTLVSSHELFLTQDELDEHVQHGMKEELDEMWRDCLRNNNFCVSK